MIKKWTNQNVNYMPCKWNISDIWRHASFYLFLIKRKFNIKEPEIAQCSTTKGMYSVCVRKPVNNCSAYKTGCYTKPYISIYWQKQQKHYKQLNVEIAAYIKIVEYKNLKAPKQYKWNYMFYNTNCQFLTGFLKFQFRFAANCL